MNTVEWFLMVAMLALVLAFFVSMVRFIYGPGFVDRLVTFDLMTANLIGVVGIYAMISNKPLLLDIALALALIGFISLIAFAYYIKNRRRDERGH